MDSILTLILKLDLAKTLRKNNEIGVFIIGNYVEFIRLAEEAVREIFLENKNIRILENKLNLSFFFTNCPLPRHNI